MTYTVRLPTREEIPYLVSMGRRMHDESAFRDMDYDEEKVRKIGYMAVSSNEHLFLQAVIHDETEVPVGMLLAGLQMTYFGKDVVANDLLLMLEKDHRGRCFDSIMRITALYREWAVERNAKRIYLGTTTGIEPDKTRMVFEACGFKQIGTLHEA